MSDHSIKVTYERDSFRANLECHAPADALCRSVPDCDCETYGSTGRDEQGWFHEAYNPDFHLPSVIVVDGVEWCEECKLTKADCLKQEEEVIHRHHQGREGGECNYQLWINADGPDELGPGEPFTVADFPVTLTWEDDYYIWAPEEAK